MTLHELLVLTKEMLPADIQISDAQIVRYINMGYEQIAGLTMCLRVPYSVAVDDFLVSFPNWVIGIFVARWTDGTNKADLVPIYWSEAINFLGGGVYNPPTGTPRYLIVFNPERCHLYPKPSLNGQVEGIMAVVPRHGGVVQPLINDDDEPKFIASQHDALAYYAAANILLPYGQHANLQRTYAETFYLKLQQIKEAADDFTMRPAMMYPPQTSLTPVIVGYIP